MRVLQIREQEKGVNERAPFGEWNGHDRGTNGRAPFGEGKGREIGTKGISYRNSFSFYFSSYP